MFELSFISSATNVLALPPRLSLSLLSSSLAISPSATVSVLGVASMNGLPTSGTRGEGGRGGGKGEVSLGEVSLGEERGSKGLLGFLACREVGAVMGGAWWSGSKLSKNGLVPNMGTTGSVGLSTVSSNKNGLVELMDVVKSDAGFGGVATKTWWVGVMMVGEVSFIISLIDWGSVTAVVVSLSIVTSSLFSLSLSTSIVPISSSFGSSLPSSFSTSSSSTFTSSSFTMLSLMGERPLAINNMSPNEYSTSSSSSFFLSSTFSSSSSSSIFSSSFIISLSWLVLFSSSIISRGEDPLFPLWVEGDMGGVSYMLVSLGGVDIMGGVSTGIMGGVTLPLSMLCSQSTSFTLSSWGVNFFLFSFSSFTGPSISISLIKSSMLLSSSSSAWLKRERSE